MTALAQRRITADEYLARVDDAGPRTELVDGIVISVAPERVAHNQTKFRLAKALDAAIARAELPCVAYPDGMSVRTSSERVREPDACVQCGRQPAADATELDAPVIVFEVVSPSTATVDAVEKLDEYFRVPSIRHYVIVHAEARIVVHHRREAEGVATRTHRDGVLRLDPPGLELPIEALFGRDDAARPPAESGVS
jgi:Uma2 family endonuclease